SLTIQNTADLSVTKTVDNANPYAGQTVHYTLTASSAGPDAGTDVTPGDPLPAGATFLSQTQTAGSATFTLSNSGNQGTDTHANAASGTGARIVVTLTVGGAGATTLTNTAPVSATANDPNLGDNTASASLTLQNTADLSVTKTVDNNNPHAGQTVHYTLA